MGSITIINNTNWPINSSMTSLGVNSSWRNRINPKEFYVHNAHGIYNAHVRYFTSIQSTYEANWERIGELAGFFVLNLGALGLTAVTMGAAAGAFATASSGLAILSGFSSGVTALLTGAVDLAAISVDIKDITVDAIPGEVEETRIHGHFHNVYVVEGGYSETQEAFVPLTMRLITQEELETKKKENEYYEVTRYCNRIFYDDKGTPYYKDQSGNPNYDFDSENSSLYVRPGDHKFTEAATGNDRGDWRKTVYVPRHRKALVMQVRNQPGYGLIDARLIDDTGATTDWTAGNTDGEATLFQSMKVDTTKMDHISEVDVLEERGYGIIDVRCICKGQEDRAGCDCGWAVGNPGDPAKNREYKIKVPNGFVVGLRGKEQGRYGLVDLKFAYADE